MGISSSVIFAIIILILITSLLVSLVVLKNEKDIKKLKDKHQVKEKDE